MEKNCEKKAKTALTEGKYYMVVDEWCYPTETGRDFLMDFDSLEEALKWSESKCESETWNFADVTGCDPCAPERFKGAYEGYVISPKNGLDDWWYAVKVVPVVHGAV